MQSCRLATIPFPMVLPELTVACAVDYAREMQDKGRQNGFAYVSLGPALADVPQSYHLVVPMLAATQDIFISGEMATLTDGVVLPAVKACREVIAESARINSDGLMWPHYRRALGNL